MDEVFSYLKSSDFEEVLTQAVLQAPIFATRWRWNATRSLAILRHTGGKKVPPPLQRMRSDDLLAAVFPAQVACQDNAPTGDIEIPDHPLVFETLRDCLTEASDLGGCQSLLSGIETGDIEIFGRDTVQPSVFSHQILNAMPYAFLDDAPLEERRARAVSLRRALPDDARDLAQLGPRGQPAWNRNTPGPASATSRSCTTHCSRWACCPRVGMAYCGPFLQGSLSGLGLISWRPQEGSTVLLPALASSLGQRPSDLKWCA